jgi:AAA domain-containing protein
MSTTWTDEQDRAFRAAVDGAPISAEENGCATVLEVITARDLCRLPDPPASDELLGNLIVRRQRTVIGADTGAGKTTFMLEMLGGIVTRKQILGFSGAGGRALVIDAEQGLKTIKRRLRETGLADSELVDYIRVPDGLSLDSDEAEAAAVEQRLAEGEYVVVLADPLYKLHRGDSNGEREAVDLMRRFDGWRERYGFALILNVHIRKPPVGAKFSMHEFFGSSAYLRGAEVVLGLQRIRDGYSRLHFFKDREGDLPVGSAWGLLFDRENGYRRDPEDEKPKQTTADQVRELLEGQPGMTVAQLVEETGKAERTVRSALKEIGADSGKRANDEALWSVGEPC